MSTTTTPPANVPIPVTMWADQFFTMQFASTIPTGGLNPAPAATFIADDPSLVTIITGPVEQGGGGFNNDQQITVTGNGQAGTTTIRATDYGTDVSDILVTLNARPQDVGAFQIGSLNIADVPANQG